MSKFGLVIHGGIADLSPDEMTDDHARAYHEALHRTVALGYEMLNAGSSSLDVVQAAVMMLEDDPLFNAGKGAVFTETGENELDAAIMEGSNFQMGMVAGVKHIKNPIVLARLIMEKSPHVMLIGAGAEHFAEEQGLELVPEHYFYTERRWQELAQAKQMHIIGNLHYLPKPENYGTVGAVALDRKSHLAAGTSTGGITNKRKGRVGDTAIVGASTYACNQTCAVSTTGHGEDIIRITAAYDISALMAYKNYTVEQAATFVMKEKLTQLGAGGGAIVIDKNGTICMPFNTQGMYRAYGIDDRLVTAIYDERTV